MTSVGTGKIYDLLHHLEQRKELVQTMSDSFEKLGNSVAVEICCARLDELETTIPALKDILKFEWNE